MELIPRQDSTDVHEASKIEKHINTTVDFVVSFKRLIEESSVPIKCCAGTKACQKIIETCAASDTNDEETECCGVEEETFAINPLPVSC